MSSNLRADRNAVSADSLTPGSQDGDVSHDAPTDLLEQLGDDYTREALEAVVDSFAIRLGDRGFEAVVERDGPAGSHTAGSTPVPATD